jgi:hypothetical protein
LYFLTLRFFLHPLVFSFFFFNKFLITTHFLALPAYCADANHAGAASTLQDTMSGVAGKPGRVIAAICIAVYCYGTTITFLILVRQRKAALKTKRKMSVLILDKI